MPPTALTFGIALGSNLGDRLTHLQCGAREVLQRSGGQLIVAAPVYETAPVDCPPGSQAFLNSVIEVSTALQPHALHQVLQEIESMLGRPHQREKNTPRPLDLDILYAGNREINDAVLTIPHPRLHLRRFVLQPLADIRPELILPGLTINASTLLHQLQDDASQVQFFKSGEWLTD